MADNRATSAAPAKAHILQRLPLELVELVVETLSLKDARSLSTVNKEWRKLVENRLFSHQTVRWPPALPQNTFEARRIRELCTHASISYSLREEGADLRQYTDDV